MKEQQVYKVKESQKQEGLPEEITIKTILSSEAIVVTSADGDYETTEEVINTFYEPKEEFSLETMPKLTIQAIDEAIALIEIFVTTNNGLAGLQAKTKLITLKEDISKVIGLKPEAPTNLLGRKLV